MRKIIYLFVLFPIICIGQTATQNYIKKTTYKQATTMSIPMPSSIQANQSITYFDALGKPIQEILSKQSGNGKNLVTHIEYDIFGNQSKEYLPYVSSSEGLEFEDNAQGNILNYYNLSTLEIPYSEKVYEASPLERLTAQGGVGTGWEIGSGHEVKLEYQTNGANEVKLYKATASWNGTLGLYDVALSQNGSTNWEAVKLYKKITKNEHWINGKDNTIEEFTDKSGRVILKRLYENNIAHDTYYVYDQYGNLTYVIPPAVVGVPVQIRLNSLCYQYKYDHHNRMVEKKIPGKQWEYIIYDKLNNVVATGPAFSPFSNLVSPNNIGWLIVKYDALNRPILTGWMQSTTVTSSDRKTIQDARNLQTSNFYETKIASESNSTVNGVSFRYTTVAWPASNYHVLTVNYYDDYNFPNAPVTIPTTIEGQTVYYNSIVKPKGLPTGNYARLLETSILYKAETSYMLYDDKARPISSKIMNYLGGYTHSDINLDFSGKVNYTLTKHKRSDNDVELLIKDEFTYTVQDRLETHSQQINQLPKQLIAKNEYDVLGRLAKKSVGGTDITGASSLQKVDYSYNIKGWLTAINNINNLNAGGIPADLFAFKINYNTTEGNVFGVKPLYNGNIAETYWRSSSDNITRKYGYQYDNLNRLLQSTYQKPNDAIPINNSYNESITYDKNGNILSLLRNGDFDDPSTNIQIDALYYDYALDSNRLETVSDVSNNPKGFKDNDPNEMILGDYVYDVNGNVISDLNKGITKVVYNHLNLPLEVTFKTGNKLKYVYNGQGVKIQKKVLSSSLLENTTVDYLNGFQYSSGTLQFFPHSEGYVRYTSGNYNYVFNYKDHLGNVRLSYGLDPSTNVLKIMEENHYYAYGLKHTNYNSGLLSFRKMEQKITLADFDFEPIVPPLTFQYKYNGKELQAEFGLNMYDFGARNYDPALGRWMNIDPLAEKSRRFSTYTYANDNPVYFIDPDGMYSLSFDSMDPGIGPLDLNRIASFDNLKGDDWFVNNKTGAVIYVKDQSILTQEIADKMGAGDARNYDRLGPDNMFGNKVAHGSNTNILDKEIAKIENPVSFMKNQGYEKAEKVEVREKEIVSGGHLGEEKMSHTVNTLEQLGNSKITYAKGGQLNMKTNIETNIDNGDFSSIYTKTYSLTKPYGQNNNVTAIYGAKSTSENILNSIGVLGNLLELFFTK
ncbi:DUF6443 domain-containing protein [Flavobacterium sp. '19STA2R22 D10 B1']|uniref:DUF6443 domain-containing protein n=1 Tax=Flavobacterium aerium TaxID=3037261 RepID=UPI00278C8B8C|nr:DUF6443 domain-containing protein [Flavobacterium sp. '19STA2R22 D10 B1']